MNDLNSFFKSLISKREVSNDTPVTRFIGDISLDDLLKEDVLKKRKEYLAKVYDAWEESDEQLSAGSFWNSFSDKGGSGGKIVMVRARILPNPADQIPVYDGIYVDPDTFPQGSYERIKAINALPVFQAKFPDMKKPDIGTIARVTFQNKKFLKGPRYLGSAKESQISTAPAGQPSSSSLFNKSNKTESRAIADLVSRKARAPRAGAAMKPPITPGEVALIMGDSGAQGGWGQAFGERLSELGWNVQPGLTRNSRKQTCQVGSQIRAWLKPGCHIFSPKRPQWGTSGMGCLEKYLKSPNPPSVVYIILGGNGGTGEEALELISKIRGIVPNIAIVWVTGLPAGIGRNGSDKSYLNEGRSTRSDWTKGRIARYDEIANAVKQAPNVTVIEGMVEYPEYKNAGGPDSETVDGLHYDASAIRKIVARVS